MLDSNCIKEYQIINQKQHCRSNSLSRELRFSAQAHTCSSKADAAIRRKSLETPGLEQYAGT